MLGVVEYYGWTAWADIGSIFPTTIGNQTAIITKIGLTGHKNLDPVHLHKRNRSRQPPENVHIPNLNKLPILLDIDHHMPIDRYKLIKINIIEFINIIIFW